MMLNAITANQSMVVTAIPTTKVILSNPKPEIHRAHA
jgi:hypothetical protein